MLAAAERGEPRPSNMATRGGAPQKVLPIETPAMLLDELNRLTGNFGQKSLIGEGSYGRVFFAKLSDGQQAAIKKLDTSASQEPDSDFAEQVVHTLFVSMFLPPFKELHPRRFVWSSVMVHGS